MLSGLCYGDRGVYQGWDPVGPHRVAGWVAFTFIWVGIEQSDMKLVRPRKATFINIRAY